MILAMNIKLHYKLYKNTMTRTKFIVALCIFVVVLSISTLILSPTGIVVNRALRAEYAALEYENDKKEAELQVLRDNLETEKEEKSGKMPSKDEVIYRFTDETPRSEVAREPEPVTHESFKGISMSYLLLIALACSLVYLGICLVLSRLRRRRIRNERRDYREEEW